MVLLGVAALLALSQWIIDDNSLRPIPVATVLKNPGNYENRVVTLTGSVLSTMEVVSLEGQGCRSSAKRLDGSPWACAVLVRLPSCSGTEPGCSKGTLEVGRAYREMRDARSPKPTRVSMTGWLRLAPMVDAPDGRKVQLGLGHMGAFRAELIVVDAKIIPK